MLSLRKFNLKSIKSTFNFFDTIGDGKINQEQLGECIRALGINPTESEVNKFKKQFKVNERITFDKFVTIYREIQEICVVNKISIDDYIETLRQFEDDKKGFISVTKLRHLLTVLGDKLTEDELTEICKDQADADGNINYENFIKELMQ